MPRTKTTKRKAKPPTTGPTKPRQFRLTDADLATVDELARRWGPVKPLTRTDVLREMIRRTSVAELGTKP